MTVSENTHNAQILREIAAALRNLDSFALEHYKKERAALRNVRRFEAKTVKERRLAQSALDMAADNLGLISNAIATFGCHQSVEFFIDGVLRRYAAKRNTLDGIGYMTLCSALVQDRGQTSPSVYEEIERWANKTELANKLPEPDGVYPPNRVRLGGINCETLTPTQIRIVQYMLDKHSAPRKDVVEYAWESDPNEYAIWSMINKMNRHLSAAGIRTQFYFRNNYFEKKQPALN